MARLVEILARELKEWPDCKCGEKIETKALTQDDDGRINALDSGCSAEQDQFNGGVWSGAQWSWTDLNFERAEDYTTAIVTQAEWQAVVDALNKPEVVEWDGVGLPPIGAFCEHEGSDGWSNPFEVEVIAHKSFLGHEDGGLLAVFVTNSDVSFSSAECFRPIRTPEQVAAEERRTGIEEMRKILTSGRGTDWAAFLYDAGYRKQELK